MAAELRIQSLDEIDRDALVDNTEVLRSLWQTADGTVDTEYGVLNSLVLQPNALLNEVLLENIDIWNKSTNLATLSSSNVDSVDSDLLERLAANFKITKNDGEYAKGLIRVNIDSGIPLSIPGGYAFYTNDGFRYITEVGYTVSTIIDATSVRSIRRLQKASDNTYWFTVPVVAENTGMAYNIEKGTEIIPSSTIPQFISAEVYDTFYGGTDEDTNATVLNKVEENIVLPVLNGKANMVAALNTAGLGVISSAVIGINQKEMTRDTHAVFPVSYGGKADWYVRSAYTPISETLTTTATCVAKTPTKNIWRIFIGKEAAAGLLFAENFANLDDTTIALSIYDVDDYAYETRGFDTTPYATETVPDIETASEACFSAYQTATYHVISDIQTPDNTALNTKINVSYTATRMPNITDIQLWALDDNRAMISGDILVKAPHMCRTTITFTLKSFDTITEELVSNIKQGLISLINTYAFAKTLPKSLIVEKIHHITNNTCYVENLNILGSLRAIKDTESKVSDITLTGTDTIAIPNLDEYSQLSMNTTCFYTDANNILISY